jgi:rRNA maturation endonuclease Nob1
MVKLVCNGCNIKFDGKNLNECPHCGRDILEKDSSAEDLLNEVEEILED